MPVVQGISEVTSRIAEELAASKFKLSPGASETLVNDLAHEAVLAIRRRVFVDRARTDSDERWAELVGPFYDTAGVRKVLGVSRQAVNKRKDMLALKTGSGALAYPTFQFVDGGTLPGLGDVLAELPEVLVSRWTVASWLVSPSTDLDGRIPVDLLMTGDVAPVARVARAWATQLAA